jgi:hypothetical protein
MPLLEKLNFVLQHPFERLTYTEAVSILERSGRKFEFPVKWGIDLQSEHERYLVEKHFKKPVILTHYPKEIKALTLKHYYLSRLLESNQPDYNLGVVRFLNSLFLVQIFLASLKNKLLFTSSLFQKINKNI